ncbi:MAG TPA: hypothetical protein VL651_07685, partial [Bacteroidia bacterium]|nr:hypothetical protein [Bacteroidia bacterium]
LTVLNVPVYPAYDEAGYVNAVNDFDKRYAAYQSVLNTRTALEQTARSNYENAVNAGNLNATNTQASQASTNVATNVLRVFSISGFGVYNCDHAGTYPQGATTIFSFLDENGGSIGSLSFLYHVDKSHFSLYLQSGNPARVSYDPASENMMWGVKDGTLYYSTSTDFTHAAGGDMTMHKLAKPFASGDEMKNFFGIGTK